jgi:hypothetical protein
VVLLIPWTSDHCICWLGRGQASEVSQAGSFGREPFCTAQTLNRGLLGALVIGGRSRWQKWISE